MKPLNSAESAISFLHIITTFPVILTVSWSITISYLPSRSRTGKYVHGKRRAVSRPFRVGFLCHRASLCNQQPSTNHDFAYCNCRALAVTMDQALQTWRDSYGIEDGAYTQLRFLLVRFGIPSQFANFTDESGTIMDLPESSLIDRNVFSAVPFESGINRKGHSDQTLSALYEHGIPDAGFSNQGLSVGLFESGICHQGSSNKILNAASRESGTSNQGYSNRGLNVCLLESGTPNEGLLVQALSRWHGNKSSISTGASGCLGSATNEYSTGSPQLGNICTSNPVCNTAAEGLQSPALAVTQPVQDSPSRPVPCIRCSKKKLRIHLVGSLEQYYD